MQNYPKSIIVILDSKPRWRGEIRANGLLAKKLYRGMDHGEVLEGAVVCTSPEEFSAAWSEWRSKRPIIVQEDKDLDFHAWAVDQIYTLSKKERLPILIYVDETMDHFHPSTQPRSRGFGYSFTRICRSGRELGIAAIFASQRTKSIPTSVLEEMSTLYLFELDFEQDVKRLQEMGVSGNIPKPKEHVFYQYVRKGKHWRGPYKLAIK